MTADIIILPSLGKAKYSEKQIRDAAAARLAAIVRRACRAGHYGSVVTITFRTEAEAVELLKYVRAPKRAKGLI